MEHHLDKIFKKKYKAFIDKIVRISIYTVSVYRYLNVESCIF
jgi:hypothetical protein